MGQSINFSHLDRLVLSDSNVSSSSSDNLLSECTLLPTSIHRDPIYEPEEDEDAFF
jgi:hypothetical protein